MTEKEEAVQIANDVLENPYTHDGDISVLARQFLRAREEIDAMREALEKFARAADDLPDKESWEAQNEASGVVVSFYAEDQDDIANWKTGLCVGDLRRARAVLNNLTVPQVDAVKAVKIPHPGKSAEQVEPPSVDISGEAVAERAGLLRRDGMAPMSADMLIALAADRDRLNDELELTQLWACEHVNAVLANRYEARDATIASLRTFVRSARGIIQAYADWFIWQDDDGEFDPKGARAWLAAESTEIGTARDGVDQRISK